MNGSLSCFLSIYAAYSPNEAIFLGQLIPQHSFPYNVCITVFHMYLVFILGIAQTISYSLNLCTLFSLTIILSKELNLNYANYKTSNDLRSLNNLMHTYRSFQILMQNLNIYMGHIVWTGHLLCMGAPVLFNVVLIRNWEQLQTFAKLALLAGVVIGCGIWMSLLECGKLLFLHGVKTLRSWKLYDRETKRDKIIIKKFHKSCRLILICYGRTLVFGRINQFLYVMGLFKWTFKLTLALKR